MTSTAFVRVRIDENLKDAATAVLSEFDIRSLEFQRHGAAKGSGPTIASAGGDFLLIYQVDGDLINFARAGTHAELFE